MTPYLLSAALLLTAQALEQYPQHNQYHNMYKQYQQPGADNDCCNQDCSPAEVRYNGDELEFHWIYAGRDMGWFPVPPSQILPSFDHQYHICAYRVDDEPVVRCAFVPGSV